MKMWHRSLLKICGPRWSLEALLYKISAWSDLKRLRVDHTSEYLIFPCILRCLLSLVLMIINRLVAHVLLYIHPMIIIWWFFYWERRICCDYHICSVNPGIIFSSRPLLLIVVYVTDQLDLQFLRLLYSLTLHPIIAIFAFSVIADDDALSYLNFGLAPALMGINLPQGYISLAKLALHFPTLVVIVGV